MNIPSEVLKWLKENAYAVKDGEHWFITDFPEDEIPDNLHIPMNKRRWQPIQQEIQK